LAGSIDGPAFRSIVAPVTGIRRPGHPSVSRFIVGIMPGMEAGVVHATVESAPELQERLDRAVFDRPIRPVMCALPSPLLHTVPCPVLRTMPSLVLRTMPSLVLRTMPSLVLRTTSSPVLRTVP